MRLFAIESLRLDCNDTIMNDIIQTRDLLLSTISNANQHNIITGSCTDQVAKEYASKIH